jgi:hypothetical protein
MVRGLFRRSEWNVVLSLATSAVTFLTPETVVTVLESEDLATAWEVTNLYLHSIGARATLPDTTEIVGIAVGEKCYVSLAFFEVALPYSDYVTHETAHLCHNVKRERVGLKPHFGSPWLLPIRFAKRETFAYACEVYSRLRACGKKIRLKALNEVAIHIGACRLCAFFIGKRKCPKPSRDSLKMSQAAGTQMQSTFVVLVYRGISGGRGRRQAVYREGRRLAVYRGSAE